MAKIALPARDIRRAESPQMFALKQFVNSLLLRGAKDFLSRRGYEYYPRDYGRHPSYYRLDKLREQGIELVLDVGANTGQYARALRGLGYSGKIVSFEPAAAAYAELTKSVNADPLWTAYPYALGNVDGEADMHISANAGLSSSLLEMAPAHTRHAPDSGYVREERIQVKRLDSIAAQFALSTHKVFLKLDVQGLEKEVLAGAERSLSLISGIQIELSLLELYRGAPRLDEMLELMRAKGFSLLSVEPGFRSSQTEELLQVDGVFFRLLPS